MERRLKILYVDGTEISYFRCVRRKYQIDYDLRKLKIDSPDFLQ